MSAVTGLIALLSLGLALALARAFTQNRATWAALQGAGRSLPSLLRDALVLWSPLALVIVVLAFAANRIVAGTVSLTYRLTTLDEFCKVLDLPGGAVIPCTGMEGELTREQLRFAGAQDDLDRFVSREYRETRKQLLALSPDGWRQLARPALYSSISPRGVLGLEPAPEQDPELSRLKLELRELVRTPTEPAREMLDIVRFVQERDMRLVRLRKLTSKVKDRRQRLNDAAYAGLPREEQGRLWLQHRLSMLLAPVPAQPDSETEAAWRRMQGDPTADRETLPMVRRGIVTLLASNEAAVSKILMRETKTPRGSAGLYIALAMPRRCTVAAPDTSVRLSTADFASDGIDLFDQAMQSNSGSVDCPHLGSATGAMRLESLGFRASVRRSIDRWHDEMLRTSFRRIGMLALTPAASESDARESVRELSLAVPNGIHLGRADCGWLRPTNCAANAVAEALEAGFANWRAGALDRTQRGAGSVAGAAALTLEQRIGRVLVTLDADLDDMRASAQVYADRLFLLGDLIRIFGWLAVALITVKSFLYVLALEIFHSDERLGIGFDVASPIQGEYRSARQLTIDRDFPHALITRKQLSNTDNNVCLAPWPWSAPLSRMFRRRYFIFTRGRFLSDVDHSEGAGQAPRGMVASAGGGLSIVEWKLQPGEEVIFAYKDFYGASENVRLASEISFRLSTLLLGRIVFRIARCSEGEGRLLLKANVEELDQEHIRAIPPERMIAWNRHAQFSIHSGRTMWKTLLNGYTLVRRVNANGPSGLVVVSSDEAGSNLGSIRFIRRIFSAIF